MGRRGRRLVFRLADVASGLRFEYPARAGVRQLWAGPELLRRARLDSGPSCRRFSASPRLRQPWQGGLGLFSRLQSGYAVSDGQSYLR